MPAVHEVEIVRRVHHPSPAEPRAGLAPIQDVLKLWLKTNKVSRRVDESALFEQWKEIVGPGIAEHTRVIDAADGELVVEVNSAPLLQELSTYYERELLESFRQVKAFAGVQKLRFRPGAF
jgi:predicted nucleic acid-binding Zn ribbon protein